MNFSNNSFNLLPWREKALIKRILIQVIRHVLIILVFISVAIFVNKYFNKMISIKSSALLNFKAEFKKLKESNLKILESNFRNGKKSQLTKKIENNKNKIKIIQHIIDTISSSLSSHAFILYFSIDGMIFILRGVAEKEDEVLFLINKLNKNKFIKKLYLKNMNKKSNENSIAFQIEMTLRNFSL